MINTRSAPILALVALSLGGCAGESAPDVPASTRADSAGVEIVTSAAPAWTAETGWQLGPTPSTSIGSFDGAPEQQLFRVTSARRLDDGRIALANSGSSEIRFYDDGGRHLLSVGGEGEGPGEFGFLFRLDRLPGDTLLAYDTRARRISKFSPEGEFLDSSELEQTDGRDSPRYLGAMSADRFLAVVSEFPGPEEFEDNQVLDLDDTYWAFDADGSPIGEIGRYPRPTQVMNVSQSNGQIQSVSIRSHPFARGTRVAAASGGYRVLTPDAFEVAYVDVEGNVTRIARFADVLRPLTQEMLDEFVAAGDPPPTPEVRSERTSLLEAGPSPEFLPTAADVVVDTEGNTWTRPFSSEGSLTEVTGATPGTLPWTVVSSDGVWLGTVDLPSGFRPLEIGADYVLGVQRDELDIEYVHSFPLIKER